MTFLLDVYQQPAWFLSALLIIVLWEVVWKGIGLWYAAKHNQRGWFIAILLINLVGLLPIIYLFWFKPKEKKVEAVEQVSVRRKSALKRSKR